MSRAGDEKRRENAVVEKAEKTWTEKSKKWLTNGGGGCIIFLVSSASVLRAKPNSGDLHSGSAVDSDSTCGSSILSSPTRPQPIGLRYFRGIAQLVARLVRDEEAVGSNPAAPTKKNQYTFVYWFFFVSARDLNRAAVRSTANKAIVWLCLARGFHRLGMSNRVHAARSSGICNPKSFDLCSKYDILEKQSHIWLQNGQKSEEKQKLCRKQKRKNGRSRFL